MPRAKKPPAPPKHLSAESKKLWKHLLTEFEFEPHHLVTLTDALEFHDRAIAARKVIDKKGQVYEDRFGQPKPRPEVAIERDSKEKYRLHMRELGLDEYNPDDFRPPRSRGRNRY